MYTMVDSCIYTYVKGWRGEYALANTVVVYAYNTWYPCTVYVHVYKQCIHVLCPFLPFLTSTASTRGQASLWAAVTLQQRMASVAAMRMRWTRGCGSLGVASRAWVVCRLKRQVPGRRLLRRRGSCGELRLACVASLIGPDQALMGNEVWLWVVSVQCPNMY